MNKFNVGDEVELTRKAATGALLDDWGTVVTATDIIIEVEWQDGEITTESPLCLQPRSRTLPKPIRVQPEAEAAFVALAKALGYEVQKVAP